MSIQKFTARWDSRFPLVDERGIATINGKQFFLGIYNRTGAGTGIIPVVSVPLSASGATIDDALQLTDDWNNVQDVGAASGVAISSALDLQPGNDIWVFNAGGGNLNVYPPSGQFQIDALGNGNPYVLASGKLRCFQCWSASQFHSYGN